MRDEVSLRRVEIQQPVVGRFQSAKSLSIATISDTKQQYWQQYSERKTAHFFLLAEQVKRIQRIDFVVSFSRTYRKGLSYLFSALFLSAF